MGLEPQHRERVGPAHAEHHVEQLRRRRELVPFEQEDHRRYDDHEQAQPGERPLGREERGVDADVRIVARHRSRYLAYVAHHPVPLERF
jgi:hypothetical protein